MQNFEFERLIELVGNSRSIVITSHHNPDGDAIGSVLALALVLKKMGKQAFPMVPNDYPEFLKWMPGNESMVVFSKQETYAKALLKSADLIFCLDYNALSRTVKMQEWLQASTCIKILIDHHLQPVIEDFDYYYSTVEVSSTSELLYRFFQQCGWMNWVEADVAAALFVGIMTDTGSFSYSCDYPETFEVTAALVRAGIQPGLIHRLVYDTYSESRLRLLGYCLIQKLTVLQEYHTAYIALTADELNRFDHQVGDTEGVVNYALSIEGISFAILLTERSDRIRLSFRSKGEFSVNSFAREHFSGGGHLNAAGGDSYLSMDQTISKLVSLLPQYKAQLDRSST